MTNQNTLELIPTNRQKSFYGKALVINDSDGTTLMSYGTKVIRLTPQGKVERLWGGYSATTMKHINSFCDTFNIDGGGKAWWDKLEM